jgi:hypothetical protein
MKRIITPIIIGTLALASCGGTKTVYVESTDAPDTTTKVVKTTDAPIATPAPTLPPVTWTAEDEFLYDVSVGYDGIIYVSDSEMIETGYTVCVALQGGASGGEVINAIIGAGGDTVFLTSVVASAVLNFCPDQQWKFQ